MVLSGSMNHTDPCCCMATGLDMALIGSIGWDSTMVSDSRVCYSQLLFLPTLQSPVLHLFMLFKLLYSLSFPSVYHRLHIVMAPMWLGHTAAGL